MSSSSPVSESAPAESFATYLAKRLIATKGYQAGTVPEAQELASACDVVITRADGMQFSVVCIVDRERDPNRLFTLSQDKLVEIGTACSKYAGRVGMNKMPVTLSVMEVSRGAIGDDDRNRLGALRRAFPGRAKVVIAPWILDTASATAWTNVRFGGRLAGRGLFERMMREPRLSEAQLFQPPAALPESARQRPVLTYAILAVLAAMFGAEQLLAVEPGHGLLAPSVKTLVALGGLNRGLVLTSHEWYRLLVAALLHGDIMHLVLNGVALFMGGVVLEGLIGRAWYLALFVIGTVGGSLMSLAINPANMVGVGASGAIMGLLAGAFVSAYRLPEGPSRTQIQMGMARMLVPSLIPLATSRSGAHIDFGAHLGGALAGGLIGLVLLRTWPRTSPLPRFTGLAKLLSAAGVIAVVLGLVFVHQRYPVYTLANKLIPDDELPQSDDDARARADALVAKYPHDPRARAMLASTRIEARDFAGAERELRAGLGEQELMTRMFVNRNLEIRLRGMLAAVLLEQGRADEAKQVARPACTAGEGGQVPGLLQKLNVCR
jgi:rhomboid protease GluP